MDVITEVKNQEMLMDNNLCKETCLFLTAWLDTRCSYRGSKYMMSWCFAICPLISVAFPSTVLQHHLQTVTANLPSQPQFRKMLGIDPFSLNSFQKTGPESIKSNSIQYTFFLKKNSDSSHQQWKNNFRNSRGKDCVFLLVWVVKPSSHGSKCKEMRFT